MRARSSVVAPLLILLALPLCRPVDARGAHVTALLGELSGHPVGTAARDCSFAPVAREAHEGEPVSEFRYDLRDGRYAHVRVLDRVDFVPEKFRLTVRGNGDDHLRIVVRVKDAHGEEFNVWPDERIMVSHRGWKTYAWAGGWQDSWGANANRNVEAPVTGVELLFEAHPGRSCLDRFLCVGEEGHHQARLGWPAAAAISGWRSPAGSIEGERPQARGVTERWGS